MKDCFKLSVKYWSCGDSGALSLIIIVCLIDSKCVELDTPTHQSEQQVKDDKKLLDKKLPGGCSLVHRSSSSSVFCGFIPIIKMDLHSPVEE